MIHGLRKQRTSRKRKRSVLALLLVGFALAGGASIVAPSTAHALSGSDFSAGRIIDDGVFFNPGSMTLDQVQAFLNAKVPNCDTNGTQASSHWNGSRYYTRAEWGALNGNPAPYTCLKNYRMDVPDRMPDTYCPGRIYGGNKSAAQVISDVSNACAINPQTMLIILQKEQGLVTDDWPWQDQYAAATGYACPDTAACDTQYSGLFNQLYNGARQYQRYAKQASQFNFRAYSSPNIRYNPSTDCGSSSVYIHSQATAGLYNYTPYQPNAAALNNLYGSGDGCSAYGNRNFWRMFNDWFGSTTAFNANITLSSGLTTNARPNVYRGETITASYTVSNSADYDILAGGLGICARQYGTNYDFGFIDQNTIPAHGSKTISFSKTLNAGGVNLDIFVCSYHASIGGWASSFYPYPTSGGATRSLTLQVQNNPLVTSGITMSPASPAAGQLVTASTTYRNYSPSPINIGSVVVAARDPYGGNVDFPEDANVTIPGNGTYTYSKSRTLPSAGTNSFFLANYQANTWYQGWPASVDGSIVKQGTVAVQNNPLLTTNVSLSPANPVAGQPVTATVSIRNASASAVNLGMLVVAARDPNGGNVDFPAVPDLVIPANTTYTYSQSRIFTASGKHSFFLVDFHDNVWDRNYPLAGSGITRQGDFQVGDNPLVTSGVSFSPTTPRAGQSVTATMTLRNTSSASVSLGQLLVAARDPNGNNVDFPSDPNVTIAAGATYTYSKSRTMPSAGNYQFFIANLHDNTWERNFPGSANGSVVRSGPLSVIP